MMKNSISKIINLLQKEYPDAKTALNFSNPLEILVATILSAQCTDERVNKVTKELFKKYKTVDDYANADIKKFEQEIKSTGFYKMKAKNIINAAKMIKEKFGGKVPDNMEDLLKLPGVARKTANVVLGNAYGKVEGIVVDTHVRRLSYRIGLTKNTDPTKIEQDLMKIVPKDKWFVFPYLLIEHGRKICTARKPLCDKCVIEKLCKKNFN
ncbi:MAG: endonuclease III [Endomicrobia bacterium]|nr:endonuclease III [Endomicrobiia bacterium]MDW8056390.1 endonuclease III [Elusimicrobiota bacterium]